MLTETKKVNFTCFTNCEALKSSLQPYKMCLPGFPCKNKIQVSNKYSQEEGLKLIFLLFLKVFFWGAGAGEGVKF